MNSKPLVSISLITYNQQDFIAASIESALDQDYENLEIVIGDDCSSDSTWDIVQRFKSLYPDKIKAFRNPKNLGITNNSNEALNRCAGKYVAFFAGDDLLMPNKISSQVSLMEANEKVVLTYHEVEMFRSHDNATILNNSRRGFSNAHVPVTGLASKVAEMVIQTTNGFMPAMSVMTRRSAIPHTGFDVRVPVVSDWLMWIEILANSDRDAIVEYLPKKLARYRRHDSNVTSEPQKCSPDLYITLAIVESKYPWFLSNIDKSMARVRYSSGIAYILSGSEVLGRRFLLLSLRSRWVSWKILYWLAVTYAPSLLKLRPK